MNMSEILSFEEFVSKRNEARAVIKDYVIDCYLNYPNRLTSDGDSVGRSPQNTDLVQLTVIRYAPRNPKERAAYRTGAPDIPSIQVPAAPYNWNVQNPW